MNRLANLSYPEFHALAMLYAARIDGSITLEEEKLISPTLSAETYQHIKNCFEECNDAAILEALLSYRDKYFATEADKDKLLADMNAVIQVDHKYEQMEKEMFHLFARLIQ